MAQVYRVLDFISKPSLCQQTTQDSVEENEEENETRDQARAGLFEP